MRQEEDGPTNTGALQIADQLSNGRGRQAFLTDLFDSQILRLP
jgi:hypothetical protein